MERRMDRQMKDKLEQAPQGEVIPGFDADQEWQLLHARLHPTSGKRIHTWRYAATVLVLVAVAGIAAFIMHSSNTQQTGIAVGNDTPAFQYALPPSGDSPGTANNNTPAPATTAAIEKQHSPKDAADHGYTSRYKISNGTDCPMEISISQTMKCPNSKPAAISSISTLEPGQSAELNYKGTDSVPRNCSLTVEEIEIKSITTGEAITLNASSSPSTAQEVFSYISGEKRGDVLAGMFTRDCNKHAHRQSIRFDNRGGNVIVQ